MESTSNRDARRVRELPTLQGSSGAYGSGTFKRLAVPVTGEQLTGMERTKTVLTPPQSAAPVRQLQPLPANTVRPSATLPNVKVNTHEKTTLPVVATRKINPNQTTLPETKGQHINSTTVSKPKVNNTVYVNKLPTPKQNSVDHKTVLPSMNRMVNSQPTSISLQQTKSTYKEQTAHSNTKSASWVEYYPTVQPPLTISDL